jgi:hypothetical protein
MEVMVQEVGDRPVLLTNSRRFAPQGAVILGQLLERFRFADYGFVTLDWSNELGLQPEAIAKPIVLVETVKRVGDRWLRVSSQPLDVEQTFGMDEITADDLFSIVKSLEEKTLYEIERSK